MKVILPVIDNESCKNQLSKGFHNAKFACIYDCNDKSYTWLQASEISANPGNLSLELKRKGIYTVICNTMALMALGLFLESGLEVYRAQGDSLIDNIQLFENKELKAFHYISSLDSSACSGMCSSCGTTCN